MQVTLLIYKETSTFFCQAVVDVQEIYAFFNTETPNISFKALVASFLGINVCKLPQVADWRVRPLHDDLIKYAVNDAKLLLQCYYLMVAESDLSMCKLTRSKRSMLKCYSIPSKPCANSCFEQSLKDLPMSCKVIFNVPEQKDLYVQLFNFRESKCLSMDLSRNNFMPLVKLALITRSKPTTKSYLCSLFNQVKYWPEEIIPEFLSLISNHRYVENGGGTDQSPVIVGRPPGVFSDTEMVSDDEDELMNVNDEILPEDMIIEVQNDNPPAFIDVRVGRNKRNCLKKLRLKQNRRIKNQARIESGQIPIKYQRNKGRKHKIRQLQRKLARLS
jgi:ribonuclease D